VHGQIGSWVKYGFDPQERQLIAALRRGDDEGGERERALYIDGATGSENETPIPLGDYRRFYAQLRDVLHGAGPNPVPPAQALAVTAVVETAVRSSSERRVLPLPLTVSETAISRRELEMERATLR